MIRKTWRVLLSVAFVLLVFCAVRAVRRPAVSKGAQRPEVGTARAQANEARESVGAVRVEATHKLQLRQLETAQEAQRMKQQEAATELQRRQEEAIRPPSENPGASVEAVETAARG
jgi:hypothetical protein